MSTVILIYWKGAAEVDGTYKNACALFDMYTSPDLQILTVRSHVPFPDLKESDSMTSATHCSWLFVPLSL